jgi:hypothetical protein
MGSTSKTTTKDSKTVQGPEQWMQDEGSALYNNAASAVPEKFTPYKGERVADYGQDYYDARDMVRGIDVNSPDMQKFRTVLDTLYDRDSDYLKGSTKDHMDPYTAAVLDPTLRNLNDQRLLQSNEDNRAATMAGAFGDPQAGIAHALSNDKFNSQVSDATNKAYSDAWRNAQGQENLVSARLSDTGKGYGTLDQALFNKTTALGKILSQFGMADQAHKQALDDVDYDNFKMGKQGGWAMTRSGALMQLLNATPHDEIQTGHSTEVEKSQDNSGLQMLGKLAGTALGAYFGGPAGAQAGASLFGGGGGGSSGGGGSGGGGSFFNPYGSVVNNASTGGQAEFAPQYAGYNPASYFTGS